MIIHHRKEEQEPRMIRPLFFKITVAVSLSVFLLMTGLTIHSHRRAEERSEDSPLQSADTITGSAYAGITRSGTTEPPRRHRVLVPVKTRPRVPDKERNDNLNAFLVRENREFGTSMPVYKKDMIEMLREEAEKDAPAALTEKEIQDLKESGDVIF